MFAFDPSGLVGPAPDPPGTRPIHYIAEWPQLIRQAYMSLEDEPVPVWRLAPEGPISAPLIALNGRIKPVADDVSRVQRLKYRAWRRGMRECDLVLGAFADARLPTMSDDELDAFEALMEAPDDQLLTWILGSAEPDPEFAGPMLDQVIAFGREDLA